MHVCSRCFASATIRQAIDSDATPGRCDLCQRHSEQTTDALRLIPFFRPFLQEHYRKSAELAGFSIPEELMPQRSLASILQADGFMIFSADLPLKRRSDFLDLMLGQATMSRGWWYSAVDFTFAHSDEWRDFTRLVRTTRRYVTTTTGTNVLNLLRSENPGLSQTLPFQSELFRARIWHDELNPPTSDDLKAPPYKLARTGRANARGIRILYLASTPETAIAEVRPHVGAVVAVAKVRPKRALRIFDLSAPPRLSGLDPFAASFSSEVKTAKLVGELNREFAQRVAPDDSEMDYVPTQIVAEMINEQGYDGVRYRSAMDERGHNYAFFDPQAFLVEYHNAVMVKAARLSTVQHDPSTLRKMLESFGKTHAPSIPEGD